MTLHFENPNTSSEGISNGCVLSDKIDWNFYNILSPFFIQETRQLFNKYRINSSFFLLLRTFISSLDLQGIQLVHILIRKGSY